LNPQQIKGRKMKSVNKINHTKSSLKNKGENKKKITRGQTKLFNLMVKLNWKIPLTKEKKINEGQIEKK